MDQQPDPSAARSLLDLPVNCLHHIVSFMDGQTKRQFFRTSKGSQDEPGCAVLVLRASNTMCRYKLDTDPSSRPAYSILLHWASQISTDMKLEIGTVGLLQLRACPLMEALHNLLLYPQARVTRSRRSLGRPATYPGITALRLEGYLSASFIPELLADAFPNLKSFSGNWLPDISKPPGSILTCGLSSLQHVQVDVHHDVLWQIQPAATYFITQQLSHLPSLTSLHMHERLFREVPAVFSRLSKLRLCACDTPTAEHKAALKACSQLESLHIGGSDKWLRVLPLHVPSITRLVLGYGYLTDERLPLLLALPNLVSLVGHGVDRLNDDYSSAPCSWKQLHLSYCHSHVAKLPLQALRSPITCTEFILFVSDPAADLAAIRAAKPHLLRCGGINVRSGLVFVEMPDDRYRMPTITQQQFAEVLDEWAPCLSVPQRLDCYEPGKAVIEDVVGRVWPKAEIEWRVFSLGP